MAQHSTSVPSADVALNRSGTNERDVVEQGTRQPRHPPGAGLIAGRHPCLGQLGRGGGHVRQAPPVGIGIEGGDDPVAAEDQLGRGVAGGVEPVQVGGPVVLHQRRHPSSCPNQTDAGHVAVEGPGQVPVVAGGGVVDGYTGVAGLGHRGRQAQIGDPAPVR
ncbi:MAG: hypothetical protein ACR2MN_01040 [Acidimicrobiales bacterium]